MTHTAKYTRQQIIESINYWQAVLDAMDSAAQSLNESQHETKKTSDLIDMLKKYCFMNLARAISPSKFDEVFSIECIEPCFEHSIYNAVALYDFPFDTAQHSVEHHVNVLARRAALLGYNYITHSTSDGDYPDCALVTIQFEASYFPYEVKPGTVLYHVTPKSIVHKILRNGLVPSNNNAFNYSYSPRVYCFNVNDDMLMRDYAYGSSKQSKKFVLSKDIKDEIQDFFTEIQAKKSGALFDTHEFCVLAIDTAKLKRNTKFYVDSMFEDYGLSPAVFTYDAIPPSAIEVVAEFTV